jgi:ferric-dicitrate binding protein FerR (iron transport regulator)
MNRNDKFQKAIEETFRQIKQEEKISPDEIDSSWKVIEDVLSTTPSIVKTKQTRRNLWLIGSVAASLSLLVLFSIGLINRESTETTAFENHIIAPEGRNKHLTFTDGTKIVIKANSHVIYPTVFSKDCREIKLIEGEIYLDVVNNPEVPFIVNPSCSLPPQKQEN